MDEPGSSGSKYKDRWNNKTLTMSSPLMLRRKMKSGN